MPASTITFRWKNNETEHGPYILYRSESQFTSDTLPTPLTTLPSSYSSYTDTVIANTTYYYMFAVEEKVRGRIVYSDLFTVNIKPNLYVCGGDGIVSSEIAQIRKLTTDGYISFIAEVSDPADIYFRNVDVYDNEVSGLARIGGFPNPTTYKIYTFSTDDGSVIRQSGVIPSSDDIFIRLQDRFYIATEEGIGYVMNAEGATFQPIYTYTGDEGVSYRGYTVGFESLLFVGVENSRSDVFLFKIDTNTNTVTKEATIASAASGDRIGGCVTQLEDGKICVGLQNGIKELVVLDSDGATVLNRFSDFGNIYDIKPVYGDPDHVYLIENYSRMLKVNLTDGTSVELLASTDIMDSFMRFYSTPDNFLYIATELGNAKFNATTLTVEWYSPGFTTWDIIAEPGRTQQIQFTL